MGTAFADIKPTPGSHAGTFEWIFDVASIPASGDLTAIAETAWKNVPDINSLNPTAAPKTKDATTYAHKGNTSNVKTGEDVTVSVSVKGVKDSTGEFQPELLLLVAAADSIGIANNVAYRYRHATSEAFSFMGTASVAYTRANTGVDDPEWFDFTLGGQGDRVPYTPAP